MVVTKQLLPVYDKPMIYYPLSTLMSAGIREILVVSRPDDVDLFRALLGDGTQLGIEIHFVVQSQPNGIAEAFILGEPFLNECYASTLILGDNIFNGPDFRQLLHVPRDFVGGRIFAYPVRNPQDYGVVEFGHDGEATDISEKPTSPRSNFAVPGLYVYDRNVVEAAKSLTPSRRGELEITDLNRLYLQRQQLEVVQFPRGSAWLDTGTFEAMVDASAYVRAIEARHGIKVGCVEEIAWRNGWITEGDVIQLADLQLASGYGEYLLRILEEQTPGEGETRVSG